MRTTINVDDQLLQQAKARAATLGVTLAQLIEDALRESFMRRENVEHRGRIRLITMQGTGTRPGIDLDKATRSWRSWSTDPDGCQHPRLPSP